MRSECGVALLMAMVLMSGLGLALVATTSSETMIAANFRASVGMSYAADAMAERAITDLRSVTDWTDVLNGSVRSSFVDGAPDGTRTLADGAAIDLGKILNLANCNKSTPCSAANMNAVTAEWPWGANNPRWQLYGYGQLDHVLPSAAGASDVYAIAMVGDDSSGGDGNPLSDTSDEHQPGAGILAVRVEVLGPRSAHRIVELTLTHQPELRVLSWRP